MKTAYELAMERLNKTAPAAKLTGAQKKGLAELDSKYAAKIAGREIALKDEMARVAQDFEKAEALREQLANERKKLQAELEEKKEAVRRAAGRQG
jgi:septin family protein